MFDNTKESLGDLLEEIHTGKVQLPDLQRSFTWCNEQIVKLIASISQSFPIGAIVTIKVNSNSSFTFKPRLLEGVRLKEESIPESLILDGQQRLTSMCLRSGVAVSIRVRASVASGESPNSSNSRALVLYRYPCCPQSRDRLPPVGYANESMPLSHYLDRKPRKLNTARLTVLLEQWWWSCSFGEVYNNWQNKCTASDTIEIPQWLAGGNAPSNLDSARFNRDDYCK